VAPILARLDFRLDEAATGFGRAVVSEKPYSCILFVNLV
jgi:hypothetical protein